MVKFDMSKKYRKTTNFRITILERIFLFYIFCYFISIPFSISIILLYIYFQAHFVCILMWCNKHIERCVLFYFSRHVNRIKTKNIYLFINYTTVKIEKEYNWNFQQTEKLKLWIWEFCFSLFRTYQVDK